MTTRTVTEPFEYDNKPLKRDPDIQDPFDEKTAGQDVPVWVKRFVSHAFSALFGALIMYTMTSSKPMESPRKVQEEITISNSSTNKPTQSEGGVETVKSITADHSDNLAEKETVKPIQTESNIPYETSDDWGPHTLTPGETLRNLNAKYGISIAEIYRLNGGKFTPRVGQVIQIPKTVFPTHTVTKGQTVYQIASTYNVSVQQITRLNGLLENRIKPGQVLRLR